MPWDLLAVLLLFFLFSEAYVSIIVPVFNFGGMVSNPRGEVFVELGLLIFTSLLLPNVVKKPSEFYNWLYFCVLLIPAAVLSAEQGNQRFHLFLMFAALWLLILFRWFFSQVIYRKTITKELNFRLLPYHSIFVFVIAILISVAVFVHGAFNFNFAKVYEYRFNISENIPITLRYLMPLASGALTGYLAALSIHRRDVKCMFMIIITGILFFGFSSHKSMLFNPLVAMTGYFFFKMSRPHLLVLSGLASLTVFSLLLPEGGTNLLGSLFLNRIIFIPSHINFYYFDFFSTNSLTLWAESKISLGLVDKTLPMPVMKYIGGLMTGNYNISANTGWVANGYMNAGIIGIIIYACIIGFFFALIDFWAKAYGKQLVGAAFLLPVITFIMSADLFIVILTSGLFLLIMIFEITTIRIYIRRIIFLKKKQNNMLFIEQ